MPPDRIKVTIARATLEVPIVDDEDTTRKLVEQINDRIAQYEAHAKRIDSVAFALQAAFSFAADLHRAKQLHTEETKEVTLALERLLQTLKEVLETAPNPR
jgi:hypothetical protein